MAGRGTTTSDAKTDAGTGSRKEAQAPIAQSDTRAPAATTVSLLNPQKPVTKNLSRGLEIAQRQSEGMPGSSGTVKEKSAHPTSSESNARTTSAVTIASSMIVPAEQISRSYNIFQSMLAAAPAVAISENGELSSDVKTQAFASTSSRTASIPEMPERATAATGSISRIGISVSDTTTRAVSGGAAGSPDQTKSLLVSFPASAPANALPLSTGQQGNLANSPSKLNSSQVPGNAVSQSSEGTRAESLPTISIAATTRTSAPAASSNPAALPPATNGWSYSTFQMALVSASNQAVSGNSSMDAGTTTYVAANGVLNVPQVAQPSIRNEDGAATSVATQAPSDQSKLLPLPVTISNSDPSQSQSTTANRSYAVAQTELQSAPEMKAVVSTSALPVSDNPASATVPNRIASPLEQRQSTSAANNVVAHTVAIPSPAERGSSTIVSTAQTQGKSSSDSLSESSSPSGSTIKPESSDGTSDVRTPKAAQEISPQQVDFVSVTDTSRPVATPNRLTDVAVTVAGSGNQEQATSVPPAAMSNVQSDIAAQPAGTTLQAPVDLSFATVLPRSGDSTQPVGKPVQKEALDGAGLKNSDPVNTANTGTGKTTVSTSGSHDASSHGAQSSVQSQDSQSNQSQAAAATSKTPEIGASQQPVPTAMTHAGSHEVVTPHSASDSTDNVARTTQERDVTASIHTDGEAAGTSGINTAKLIQTMSETEMRVGMNSAEFGNISIRTSISQQQMVAQISVDHSDLSQAISAHVSSVQTKLGDDHGIHALIEVNSQGASSFGDSGHSSQREQRAFVSSARTESAIGATEIDNGMNLGALVSVGNEQRLDIRA